MHALIEKDRPLFQISARVHYWQSSGASSRNNTSGQFTPSLSHEGMRANSGHVRPCVGHPCTKQIQKLGQHVYLTPHAALRKQNGQTKRTSSMFVPMAATPHPSPLKKAISIEKYQHWKFHTVNGAPPHSHDLILEFHQALSVCNNLWAWMGNIMDYKWKK